MKHISAVFMLAFCASVVFAGGLSRRYKDWPQTPQAYFMTSAERAQWSGIRTDAEAEQFVNDFVARRGGAAFVADVTQNAAQADKYLTVAETHGSMTVRGKMMILLGPSVPTAVVKKKKSGTPRLAPGASMGGFGGPTMEDMATAVNDPGNSTIVILEYTYTYAANVLPAGYGKALTVKFEVDPSGQDRLATYGAEKELEKLYEMVAQARLAAAKPATP
jgi:hypothetical protein